ncbi:MAG TPA: GNAT family N-acetyltransferase [Methylophilaceae bacterium]|nr:GNAT family N-acetyltransferase [Methylophilaceae bacterium]
MNIEIEVLDSFSTINDDEWNALTDGSPVLNHALFRTLEETGCVGPGTGWQPYPMVAKSAGELVGAIPLYLKGHSYGEYVFDWTWADVFERCGIRYYPKLLVAIPFTPVTGPRLLSHQPEVQSVLAQILLQQMEKHALSSAHVLFPDEASAQVLASAGWFERNGVQFRWENEGFADFEDFLSTLSHDKRKKIRQERKKLSTAGIHCRKLEGRDIQPADWDFFFCCYQNTYYEHHSTPYLSREFFLLLGERMPQNILLVIAERDGKPIAATYNLFGGDTLYGRYWGATQYVPGLHFELCYYQAQEFCIARGLRYFEGGAQGEHKLARGFRPRITRSFHRIAYPEFEVAIRDHVEREAKGVGLYHDELEERAPFRKGLT